MEWWPSECTEQMILAFGAGIAFKHVPVWIGDFCKWVGSREKDKEEIARLRAEMKIAEAEKQRLQAALESRSKKLMWTRDESDMLLRNLRRACSVVVSVMIDCKRPATWSKAAWDQTLSKYGDLDKITGSKKRIGMPS